MTNSESSQNQPPLALDTGFLEFGEPINPLRMPLRYGFHDIGMGNLFADVYRGHSRFCPQRGLWYCYWNGVWRPDVGGMQVSEQGKRLAEHLLACTAAEKDEGLRRAHMDFALRMAQSQRREVMLKEARSVYAVPMERFDHNPELLNCRNGVLDLAALAFLPHNPDYCQSKQLAARYDPAAACPRWEQFLAETLVDGDLVRFVQKALGYALTAQVKEECCFLLYGPSTRNGKSTLLETVLHLMGDYALAAQPETLLQKRAPNGSAASEDVARLCGARLVTMNEPERGMRLNASLLKQLTGGDTVTARYLHQNSFSFRPAFKLFLGTNHLPEAADDSVFSSGRIRVIPFRRHFSPEEQDRDLKRVFQQPEAMSGILNWMLEGLRLYREEGLKNPAAVERATAAYRAESDEVKRFLDQALTPSPGGRVKCTALYELFQTWEGGETLNYNQFVKRCKQLQEVGNDGRNATHIKNMTLR